MFKINHTRETFRKGLDNFIMGIDGLVWQHKTMKTDGEISAGFLG